MSGSLAKLAGQTFEFHTMVWFLLAGVLLILLGMVVNHSTPP